MKKLFAIMFLAILLVGTISAWDLNPFADKVNQITDKDSVTNDYLKTDLNEKYGVIQISNTLFWIETDRIVEYSLVENTEQCWINCKAEGKATLYKDGKLFEGKEFIGVESLENSQYWIGTNEVEIDDYETVCPIDVSPENTCKDILVGSHFETIWEKYNYEDLKAGDYKWKLTGTKIGQANIDFQLVSNGKTLSQWAWWNGTGGTMTYDGDYTVVTFTTNGTFVWGGVSRNISILLIAGGGGGGKSYSHVDGAGGAGGYIYNETYLITAGSYKVIVGDGGLGGQTNDASGSKGGNSSFNASSYFDANGGGGGKGYADGGTGAGGSGGGGHSEGDTSAGVATPSWQGHNGGVGLGGSGGGGGGGAGAVGITLYGGTGLVNSINGTAVMRARGGNYSTGGNGINGSGDGGRAGVYRGGNGIVIIRYLTTINEGPNITLNAPTEDQVVRTQDALFNCTGWDSETGLANVTLIINGTNNVTNSTPTNNTPVINTVPLAEGAWYWSCQACDLNANCTTSGVRNFTVDTGPQLNVTSPLFNNTNYTTHTIYFNATNSTPIDWWIANYNGTNVTLTDINTTLTVEDGSHRLFLYGNNTVGGKFGLNSSVYFNVDATAPTVSIDYPTAVNYTTAVIYINYTLVETNEHKCWYSVDNGTTNTSVIAAGTNFTLAADEGYNTYFVYCNDTFGHEGNDWVTFLQDTVDPVIALNAPVAYYNSTTTDMQFNCTASDRWNLANVSLIINATYNVTNATPTNNTIVVNTVPLGDSYYSWTCEACDSNGRCANDTTRYFWIDTSAPTLTIFYPTEINYTVNVSDLKYNLVETNPDKCWYSLDNGTTNTSVVAAPANFTSVPAIEGYNTWTVYCNDTMGTEGNAMVTFYQDSIAPVVSIDYPTTTNYTTNVSQLNYTLTETNGHMCWYSTDNGTTNNSIVAAGTDFTDVTSSEGYNTWTVYCNDTLGSEGNDMVTFFKDTNVPQFTIHYPTGLVPYHKRYTNITLNYTITDDSLSYCWYDLAGTNITLNCAANSSMNITNVNLNNITFWANDTAGNYNSSAASWGYQVFEWNRTFSTTAEVSTWQSFLINVTANASLTHVTLFYDGTEYAMTNEGGGVWNKSMSIPSTAVGANTFLFEFTYAGVEINSSTSVQTVSQIAFFACNATYFTPFVNVTFKDEATLAVINASFPYTLWTYYLGTGTSNRSLTYTNTSYNYNYTFCAAPNTSTFYTVPYVQFASSGYPQRVWNPAVQPYSSAMTTQVLYLLAAADGIYVTFQVVNQADSPLSGVTVNAVREISGSDVTVSSGTTGADGSVTFWLNPDFQHTFSFAKSGYSTQTYTFAPTQSSYTIRMGGGSAVGGYDYTRGVSFTIKPGPMTFVNDTDYRINLTITSTYWDLDEYGFTLRLRNGTVLNTTSDTADSGGILNIVTNTRDYNRIVMDYYYIVNSTRIGYSTYWNVFNTENTQWSIATFFDDFDSYLTVGFFGIDDFGRYFIIFMILFLTIGIMGYKYGATNPLVISALVFAIVFFFDVVLGLLPEIEGAVPHVLTFIAGVIFMLLIMKEVMQ